MLKTMEAGQALWHNRRVQRSGLLAFLILSFTVISLHSRRDWPAVADLSGGLSAGSSILSLPYTHLEPLIRHPKRPDLDVKVEPKTPQSPRQSANGKTTTNNPHHDQNLDPTRVALIIETRKLPHLPALLQSFIGILPPQWVVRMVGTDDAFENVRESLPLRRAMKSGKLVLTDLPAEYSVAGQEQISATLTNITFYRDFLAPAEWLLIFQADTVLCAASDQSLDDWVDLGYPWVGAPWNLDVSGGNGGLSLRHVPRIISILEKESRQPGDPFWEDRWLCDRLPDSAVPQLSKYFSVESIWYERPLGYHLRGSGKMLDMDIWGDNPRKRHIFRYCPETKLILGNMRLEAKDDEKKEAQEIREILEETGEESASPDSNLQSNTMQATQNVEKKPRKSTSEMIKEDWPAIQEMQIIMAEKQRGLDEKFGKEREDAAAAKLQGQNAIVPLQPDLNTAEGESAELKKHRMTEEDPQPHPIFDMSKDRHKLKYTYELPSKVVDEDYVHITMPIRRPV